MIPARRTPSFMPQTETQIYHRNDLNRQARTFLQDILTPGPQTYQVVHEQAVAQGYFEVRLDDGQADSRCPFDHRHQWQSSVAAPSCVTLPRSDPPGSGWGFLYPNPQTQS